MSIGDELRAERLVDANVELARVRRERDNATKEVARLTQQVESMQRALTFIEHVEHQHLQTIEWATPKKPTSKAAATLMLMLSDLHLDEVVEPNEVEGLNAYNRTIARIRLERWCANVVKLSRHYLAGMKYDGCVVMLGGDIFSGDIHEELTETNEDTMLGSFMFWTEQIASALDMLGDEFRHVHVAGVVGNHGRTSRKPRAKLRARTNFDWLLAKQLQRHFIDDKRFTFNVPEATDALIRVYDSTHLLSHGDQTSGGGGIGGIYPPIMRMRARKAQRFLATGQTFDTLWIGHWHQYLPSPSLIVNGSMKGVDEYAYVNNFGFEQPQQALAIVAPNKGITLQAPIFCADRKKEGW